MATFEEYQAMSTQELSIIFWDWYKEVNGIRPRWIASDDREAFLSFIKYELDPEVAAQRQKEYDAEKEYFDKIEEDWFWDMEQAIISESLILKEKRELEMVCDGKWDYLNN